MAGNLIEFTDQNFDSEVLQSDSPVLVDFWAEWCGPCHAIAPTIEQIANEYNGKVKVGKVNVDHNQQTAMRFGIRSIPSLLIFKDGTVVNQIVGAVPKESITKLLDETL
jgi:thioredoxin 1